MELWQINAYIIGYREKVIYEQENIVKTAYNTAAFTNAKKTRKLKYYLDKISKPCREKTYNMKSEEETLRRLENYYKEVK